MHTTILTTPLRNLIVAHNAMLERHATWCADTTPANEASYHAARANLANINGAYLSHADGRRRPRAT